ncbi:hypothetical protein GF356_03285 [candidate division GN15 bacterium]|nr:hypothetical protein [candidate division GN15 bacterium]
MRRIHWIILAVLTVLSLVGQYLAKHYYAWDVIPGFYAILGFIGCLVIIKVSKWFGKKIVFRDEDYYDR